MKTKTKRILAIGAALLLLAAAAAYAYASCYDTYCAAYAWPDGAVAYAGIRAHDMEDAGQRAWQNTPFGSRLISVQAWPPQRVPPSRLEDWITERG